MAQLKELVVTGNTRFVGDAFATTPAYSDRSEKVATTQYVRTLIDNIAVYNGEVE